MISGGCVIVAEEVGRTTSLLPGLCFLCLLLLDEEGKDETRRFASSSSFVGLGIIIVESVSSLPSPDEDVWLRLRYNLAAVSKSSSCVFVDVDDVCKTITSPDFRQVAIVRKEAVVEVNGLGGSPLSNSKSESIPNKVERSVLNSPRV